MILLLKLLLVPSLIALVTLAGRRWGPAAAGWLSAFPIVSGPILLVIALEQGADFAAAASANTLLAVLAILAFSIAYARCARFGMARAMLAALLAYALAVALLQASTLAPWPAFAAVLLALLLAPRLFGPAPAPATASPRAATGKPGADLPWRMLAGAVLALGVSHAAAGIGPRLAGLFAMFPVMSTVLVGFSHRASGPGFAVALLRGMVNGYFAFAAFCMALSLLLRTQPLGQAFALATVTALAVQLGVKGVLLQRARRPGRADQAS
ncbi:hypothetical protein LE190_02825 [Massilia oculi]|uniref:Uncharacterized protein n=1 Tax=Massilia hydrophila TaxID=3044279 RepID=A0ABS7Y5A6_9BURK|nr:hypothetical protein [Massilia oculi]MCA1854865.1 hypothetical protein [Massilia oculi]